jgi:hypothetical protein
MKQESLKKKIIGAETHSKKRSHSWMPYVAFFAVSFVFYSFLADYIFFYQEKNSLFVFTSDLLRESLGKPGGILIYVSSLLTSFYYYPVIGAMIVSGIMTLNILIASRIIFLLSGKRKIIIPFAIGLLLFFIQSDYRFQLYSDIGFLIQLSTLLLVARFPKILKGWFPVLLMPVIYFFTGGFSWIFFIFISLNLIVKNGEKRFIRLIAFLILTGITIYVSKEYLFFMSGIDPYLYPLPKLNTGFENILFGLISALIILLPLIAGLNLPTFSKIKLGPIKENLLVTALVAAVLICISFKTYDRKNQQYFHAEKLFCQGKYNELINYNRENPSTNSLSIFLNNVALCETGRLDDQLFGTLQSPDGKTLFLKWEMLGEVLRRGGYFYYATGMINEAHRWAFENMVMKGLSPEDLRMLIKTELINGNYSMASKYITLFDKTIFYRKEAAHFRKLLDNDKAVESDNELGYKIKSRVKRDFFSITDDPFVNLEMMLAGGSLNKEAIQYYCARLLLKKDYQGIIKVLPEFEKAGYTRLPVNIEEAAEALSLMNKGQLPFTGNIRVSKETEARWNQFLTIFGQYETDLKAAEPALRKQFGNTFWYYTFYR